MYIQAFVIPVPEGNKAKYTEMAEKTADLFTSYGATGIVETWEDDIAEGQHTDFRKAVQAEDGEKVVLSWMVWPDKATCDAASEKMEKDPSVAEIFGDMPFDGKRMFWGGFNPILTRGNK